MLSNLQDPYIKHNNGEILHIQSHLLSVCKKLSNLSTSCDHQTQHQVSQAKHHNIPAAWLLTTEGGHIKFFGPTHDFPGHFLTETF